MKTMIALIAAAGFAVAASSQSSSLPPKPTSAEQELTKLEQEWARANVSRDLAVLERIVAEEWTYTNPGGAVETRAKVFDDIRSGAFEASSFVSDDIKIQVIGDTALVNLRNTVVGRHLGRDVSGQTRATDIWIKRDGRWQCVASHESNLAPAPADTAAAEQELTQLERDWARAYVDRDVAKLDRLLAAEWFFTDQDGNFVTKADELRDVSSGAYAPLAVEASAMKVRIADHTAIVTGRWIETTKKDGAPTTKVVQFTDTFIRRDHRWQCIAGHGSVVREQQ